MSAASALTWPGSRVLAGWWPLLERRRPRALWVYHLLLHRVEALVVISRSPLLDRLNRLLLEALSLSSEADALAGLLGLDAALLARFLNDLQAAELVRRDERGWSLTEAGRQVLTSKDEVYTQKERRSFHFLDAAPSRFIALEHPPCEPWAGEPFRPFDVQDLRACIAQSPEWKQAHTFPLDVQSLVEDDSGWQSIALDRPEHLTVLATLTEDEDRLRGFPLQPATWQLQTDHPVLSLGPVWRETLPELESAASLDDWRQAWRDWGQPRGIPAGELEACHLEPGGIRLRVQAPRPLVERLRAARSDALKGEAWLLAGSSERVRAAALIDLREDT